MKPYFLILILISLSCSKEGNDNRNTDQYIKRSIKKDVIKVEPYSPEEITFLANFNKEFGRKERTVVTNNLLLKRSDELNRIKTSYKRQMEYLDKQPKLSHSFYTEMKEFIYKTHFNGYYSSLNTK